MLFDTFTFDLACWCSLITLLASLPTEPFFYSWHSSPRPLHITQTSYQYRHNFGFSEQIYPVFESRNVSQSRGESAFSRLPPQIHNPRHQERWYQFTGQNPQIQYRGIPVQPRTQYRRTEQAIGRRNSENFQSVSGEEFVGPNSFRNPDGFNFQNFGRTHSSHVNSEVHYQNTAGEEDTPSWRRESNEDMRGNGRPTSTEDERINFEESSRSYRKKNPREGESDLRIITPKGSGRRPGQGSGRRPGQGGNVFNTGNSGITTTEKTFRNHTHKGSKRHRPNPSKPQGGQIVFPDVYQRQKFIPKTGKCEKDTFCEQLGDDYPSDYINQVLKKEGAMFREFFGKDVISDPNITERIHAPEENSLCPFRQEVVFPRAAKNKDDKWLFVVNQDQYVQGVTVEVCLNPESRCILTEGFPLGYTPYCKQKYIERRLVAIGEDGKPHSDSFRLPSCCSCVVKHETAARMASLRSSRDTSPAIKRKPSKNS